MRRRYRQDPKTLDLVEVADACAVRAGLMIMPDIKPYRSMLDGSIVSSRSRHRQMLRDHGCVEVGNDSSVFNPRPPVLESPPGLKQAIIDAVNSNMRR